MLDEEELAEKMINKVEINFMYVKRKLFVPRQHLIEIKIEV